MTGQGQLPGRPLAAKLGIRPGHEVAVLGAPPGFTGGLSPVDVPGIHTSLAGNGPLDVIIFFTAWQAALEEHLGELRAHLAPAGGLWVAWPKRAAKLPTDMSDHAVRAVALPTGLVDNKVCAIDPVWTALRLVIRRDLR
jgi:hypothetical protein